jgi:phosphate starvation-inducible PhoH-like protein
MGTRPSKSRTKKPTYILEEENEINFSSTKKNNKEIKINQIITKEDLQKSPFQLTKKQEELIKIIENNILTTITGPAGTAKTICSAYAGLKLLIDGKINKIILTKPIVQASNDLGYLKGSLDDKIMPFLDSFYQNFEKILDKETIDFLKNSGLIEFKAISFMRGSTFDNSLIILDEAQNLDVQGLMLVTCRLGKNSRLIISGDISQHDIKRQDVRLFEYIEMIEGLSDTYNFKFTIEDIMRSPFLIKLTQRYEEYKETLYNGSKNNQHSTKKILKG